MRSFLFKTPDDYGMTGWHDLVIPADDGTSLEAWYIPAKGGESNKLIIFNHALPMCRAGFPGHFGEPWSSYDGVEIDFVIQYKHLTDAGYNVTRPTTFEIMATAALRTTASAASVVGSGAIVLV